ncbi:hypothetical protein [Streptomyces lydicus]|uniref:hypothetical protein n=1 Tax=Streptomyces lydicus TaxID=47763 RepID=UPI0036F81B64
MTTHVRSTPAFLPLTRSRAASESNTASEGQYRFSQSADQDPGQWMPPATGARCTYLAN